jgi:hypothetical protein
VVEDERSFRSHRVRWPRGDPRNIEERGDAVYIFEASTD